VAANKTTQQAIDGVVRSVAPASSGTNAISAVSSVLPAAADLSSSMSDLSNKLDDLITATQTQAQVTAANRLAVAQGATAQSSGASGSTLGAIGSVASSFLGGGVVPLISGLIDLFSGGGSDAPPALTRYAPPANLNFSAANGPASSLSGLQGVSYDQSGQPRAAASSSGGSSQAITIQVQAMDSQSFLDHSQDIASAVREAMLNMHPLNDVISDM
jgi:hypothetical protein